MGLHVVGLKVYGRGREKTDFQKRTKTSDELVDVSGLYVPLIVKDPRRELVTDCLRPRIYGVERVNGSPN